MTAATISPSSPSIHRPSWAWTARTLFLAVALVVLLGASFVVGRTSVETSRTSPVTTTVHGGQAYCRMGRPC